MAKNWAIVVGINKYNPNNFARLKYAKRDAELMRDFFREAKFDEVYYFADDFVLEICHIADRVRGREYPSIDRVFPQ